MATRMNAESQVKFVTQLLKVDTGIDRDKVVRRSQALYCLGFRLTDNFIPTKWGLIPNKNFNKDKQC